MNEFLFIKNTLQNLASQPLDNDGAILRVPQGQELVVSNDMLLEGVHYWPHQPLHHGLRKALRANLSDMAAMGATPLGYSLMLGLRRDRYADQADIERSFLLLKIDQETYACPLLGGDTTVTPATGTPHDSIAISILGHIPAGSGFQRCAGQPGDSIFVTGTIGDGYAGLRGWQGQLGNLPDATIHSLKQSYYLPCPPLSFAVKLNEYSLSKCALDVSDGLCADLYHILDASQVAATIYLSAIPLSEKYRTTGLTPEDAITGGDDYQLLFTCRAAAERTIQQLAQETATPIHKIGWLSEGRGLTVLENVHNPVPISLTQNGFTHF